MINKILLSIALCLMIVPKSRAEERVTSPFLTVSVNDKTGTWTCSTKEGSVLLNRALAAVDTSAGLLQTTDPRFQRRVSVTGFQDALGAGKQLLLSLAGPQSEVQLQLTIKVYDQFAGLRVDWQLQNTGSKELGLLTMAPIEAERVWTPPPETDEGIQGQRYLHGNFVHVLSNGFNTWDYSHIATLPSGSSIQSRDIIAVDSPTLVVGYLSAERAYGTLEYSIPSWGSHAIRARSEFGVDLEPGRTRQTDPLLILFPADPMEGLESYASAVQAFNGVHPKPTASTDWCSWYAGYGAAQPARWSAMETAMTENAQFVRALKPWGIDTLSVEDDSREQRYGDWNFPWVTHGMRNLAESLRALGLKPGVWLLPAHVSENSEIFKQHPDWLQHNSEGNNLYALDVSNPQAREYLRSLFQRIKDLGFQYVKIDGAGEFGISDSYFDRHLTRAEVERLALKTIRETLGPDIYLLGCGAPQLASVGLVDGMRIGPDQWGHIGFENIGTRYFEHRKWWLNDPDALVGNNRPVEEYRAWVTLTGISGSVITIGDDLAALSPEKLYILKRIHPVLGISGRPIDLFKHAPNNQWLLETKLSGSKSAVLALFNWGDKDPLAYKINLKEILHCERKVLVYDFWDDFFLGETDQQGKQVLSRVSDGVLTLSVPPRGVRALSLVEMTGDPQVLAVSNHLTQTPFGLVDIAWSPAEKTLKGQTTGVAGDDYHIAFYAPPGYEPDQGEVDGKTTFLVQLQKHVWTLRAVGTGRPIHWSVKFR